MTLFKKSVHCKNCEDCNQKSEFFRLLTPEETIILNEDRYEVQFKAGENIAKQGTNLTHIINLTSGYAKVYIEGINDRNLLLKLAGPYSILEGPGIFMDQRFHFSVTALEPCTVCFINVENFKKVLKMNMAFNTRFFEHMSAKRSMMYDKLISLTQKQMHGKIADALLYFAEDIYHSDDFELSISRQDLADMTALSKDSAIRILKELEKDGIIVIDGRRITIPKMDVLKEIAARG
ncbi:MAG: Crp/Fnr family transcriptional regulator [Bacteroidales bacterium]|nr:Crp/Fnr family transcriptional regulator [Bacteroidales bacterium]